MEWAAFGRGKGGAQEGAGAGKHRLEPITPQQAIDYSLSIPLRKRQPSPKNVLRPKRCLMPWVSIGPGYGGILVAFRKKKKFWTGAGHERRPHIRPGLGKPCGRR